MWPFSPPAAPPERGADAAPFRLAGDRRGVLLLHGFTGTPFEMRPLGEALAGRGMTVHAPALAGHGADAARLGETIFSDWFESVESAWRELRAVCDRTAVCGLSLGGLFALELGRRQPREVAAIASLAAPLWLAPWTMRSIRLLDRAPFVRRRTLPKIGGSDLVDEEMRRRNPSADRFPIRALASLVQYFDYITPRLAGIDRPVFVAHSTRDRTAPFASMEAIASRLGGPVERMTLGRSGHVITLDVERQELFQRLGTFFEHHLA